MSNISAKSIVLLENDPGLSHMDANQDRRALQHPEQVAGTGQPGKPLHAARYPVLPLTCPNDLHLAGKMGGMTGKRKQALEPIPVTMFNGLHPDWQDSPGNFDG